MKKTITSIGSLLLIAASVYPQDYTINFVATGASNTIESVKIENLTQGTSITLTGSEALQLQSIATDIDRINADNRYVLHIYPNPVTENSTVEFATTSSGTVSLELTDVAGKKVASYRSLLAKGTPVFSIQGLKECIYVLHIKGQGGNYTAKIVSKGIGSGPIAIRYQGYKTDNGTFERKKSQLVGGTMQYMPGDLMKFTGSSGIYKTIVMDTPAQNKTITFKFVACTDADGNNYPVVQIGDQVWMAENLKTTKYNDETDVPLVNEDWANQLSGAYCIYNNDLNNASIYGRLYNWYATNLGKLAPLGWHVSTDNEWTALENYLGGAIVAGGKLKEVGLKYWATPNTGATNETAFTAIPGGARTYNGQFLDKSYDAAFWTSTIYNDLDAWCRGVNFEGIYVRRMNYNKKGGMSIRCLKNEVEIYGKWTGQDELSTITYEFTDSIFTFVRSNEASEYGGGLIVVNKPENNYLVLKITAHSGGASQIGKYIKIKYTTDSNVTTNITIYSLCDTPETAEASTVILVKEHAVTKL
jgi:uncharacterized protein (TIGR02145 family)